MTDPSDPDTWGKGPSPSPDATPMETWDVLVWDTRNTYYHFWEWPTFACQVGHLKRGFEFSDILRLGWEPMSGAPVRHGFLWLQESKVWTFRKKVVWLRDGTETRFTGHRVTPKMHKS